VFQLLWSPRRSGFAGYCVLGAPVSHNRSFMPKAQIMSYDQRLLFNHVLTALRRTPICSLGVLSRELGVSVRTIEAVVSHCAGKGFRDLRQEALVAEVKALLAERPARAIKEISYAMGYNSPRSFARAVKRVCGLTPEQLRYRAGHDLTEHLQAIPGTEELHSTVEAVEDLAQPL